MVAKLALFLHQTHFLMKGPSEWLLVPTVMAQYAQFFLLVIHNTTVIPTAAEVKTQNENRHDQK